MGYVVLHINKATGSDAAMTAHIERTIDPKNADKSRTHLNREQVGFPEGVNSRTAAIQHRLDNAGLTRKIGTNQVRALRIMLSGTPEDMQRIERAGKLGQWCDDNLDWLHKTYGADNVVSAVLHMDEKTPHIHATIVPIVTGQRRKAKADKKYRTKSTTAPRLCADDVMARPKLKAYQDSYAQGMAKYGLQRGIDGSQAKHITNQQHYRELAVKKERMQEEVAELKTQLKTERFKTSAAEAGSALMDGITSALGTSKVKRQQREIEVLKTENAGLSLKLQDQQQQMQVAQRNHETETAKLQQELNRINDWLPEATQLIKWGEYCQGIGFTHAQAKDLIQMKPVRFTGELYSHEHYQRFHAYDAEVRLERGSDSPGSFRLLVDRINIIRWFREKNREFLRRIGVNAPERRPVIGRKI